MGNSSSKQLRTFEKAVKPGVGNISINKKIVKDHLNNRPKEKHIVKDTHTDIHKDIDASFLEQAISLGVVNVKEVKSENNKDHSSLQLLRSRAKVEDEYKDYEKKETQVETQLPPIGRSFGNGGGGGGGEVSKSGYTRLKKEDEKQQQQSENSRDLMSSKLLTKLIKQYTVDSNVDYKKYEINENTFQILKNLIENGDISLPKYKVRLNTASQQQGSKDEFVIVEDNELTTKREEYEAERKLKKEENTPQEFRKSETHLMGLEIDIKEQQPKSVKRQIKEVKRYL
ncbi:hypothetical protein CANARDRAFT_26925 [[Candida] arabinofermentans NRRL YB-2248]|uniref:Uncharacterized protein n=1 Tax=[Candida] arabinofermentans NRRL YB-2248 TaxID=983967 RepID=A0A1E4T703_9ASCO|nr:hypothetical protein CANARDRAFT_26925 [[Candida] arabinofermentans NRRL YB-2248]